MNKQELINHTRSFVTATNGFYYILNAKDFVTLLRLEDTINEVVIVPSDAAKITDVPKWKEKLAIMTCNRQKLHPNLKIVLMKEPNIKGEVANFIFDSFLFENVTKDDLVRLRCVLAEVGKGLFVPYTQLKKRKEAKVTPYYIALSEVLTESDNQGIWLLRKFY